MDILSQLRELRLQGMAGSWQVLTETRKHHELGLQEGLELLLQAETENRDDKRFARLFANAHFRYRASVEELSLDAARGIDRAAVMELATGAYIRKGEAVLVTGATGCGKSFLVSALGHQACAQGHRVLYFNLQKLLLRIKMTRVDGSVFKFMDKLSKTDLLILDDFGLVHLDQQQRLDMMEIMGDRHAKASTIIASQLPVANWYDVFGDDTIADAVLDRLVHASHRIELKGESMRKKK